MADFSQTIEFQAKVVEKGMLKDLLRTSYAAPTRQCFQDKKQNICPKIRIRPIKKTNVFCSNLEKRTKNTVVWERH